MARISQPDIHGGGIEIRALSMSQKVWVIVYDEEKFLKNRKLTQDSYNNQYERIWMLSCHPKSHYNVVTQIQMKRSPNNAKRQRQNETTDLLSDVQIIESDTEEDVDNISHGRDNLNSSKYIGSLRHQHDMSNLGIDFVLYQVMLTVGEMVHKVEQHKKKAKKEI